MKVVVATFNQEKALVGAFSVIMNLRKDLFEALLDNIRSVIDLQLRGYNGRSGAQCSPDHLGVLAKLCPRVEKMHLGLTWPESFLFLSRFRNISHLSVFRVASVENFDLPLMVSYDMNIDADM